MSAKNVLDSMSRTIGMIMQHEFAGLVLAAGKGTRFADESGEPMPKVLRSVLGRPMVAYVIDALKAAGIADITLVVGYLAEQVMREVGDSIGYIVQAEQKGSGHAVTCARERYRGFEGNLIVMCGDSPMFRAETVRGLMREHIETNAVVTLVTATLDNPFGYGRIVRDSAGRIVRIVEEKCTSTDERAIGEVNGGAYAFDSAWLFANIDKMAANQTGEYNLTDMVRVAVEQNKTVSSVECDPIELLGVNTPEQLTRIEEILSVG